VNGDIGVGVGKHQHSIKTLDIGVGIGEQGMKATKTFCVKINL
jgi:hypothetical protein